MNSTTHQKLARRKRRIERRLARRRWKNQPRPMLSAKNIPYDLADRDHAVTCGGIGAIHLLANASACPRPSTSTSTCSSAICPTTRATMS
jgi:hypothetical protein